MPGEISKQSPFWLLNDPMTLLWRSCFFLASEACRLALFWMVTSASLLQPPPETSPSGWSSLHARRRGHKRRQLREAGPLAEVLPAKKARSATIFSFSRKMGNLEIWGWHYVYIYNITIWLFNIAMENPWNKWRFIAGKIIYKWAIFHGYVK